MAAPTPTTFISLVGAAARAAGPISTLTTPYTYAASCTDIFTITEVTYSDATETVIISDISDTRFGACQPTGYSDSFTYSPAVCPNGWAAYSMSAAGSTSSAYCCNSGYTLYSATDWPIEWATQPCVKTIEEKTTIVGAAVASGATAAHAPWNILWEETDTTTLWPVPPVFAAGQVIETWTPGSVTVYRTTTTTETQKKGAAAMTTSTWNGKQQPRPTAVVVDDGDGVDEPNESNGVDVLTTDSTLFWFLVIGLPILGTLAIALCCFSLYYRRQQKRARRRRRRRIRRLKIVETS